VGIIRPHKKIPSNTPTKIELNASQKQLLTSAVTLSQSRTALKGPFAYYVTLIFAFRNVEVFCSRNNVFITSFLLKMAQMKSVKAQIGIKIGHPDYHY